jgi:hypothetical protein
MFEETLFQMLNASFWMVLNEEVPERQEMSKTSTTAPALL